MYSSSNIYQVQIHKCELWPPASCFSAVAPTVAYSQHTSTRRFINALFVLCCQTQMAHFRSLGGWSWPSIPYWLVGTNGHIITEEGKQPWRDLALDPYSKFSNAPFLQ